MIILLIWLGSIAAYLMIGWHLGKRQLPRLMAEREAAFPLGTSSRYGYEYDWANGHIKWVFFWMIVIWPILGSYIAFDQKFTATIEGHDPVIMAKRIKELELQQATDAAERNDYVRQLEQELERITL